MWNDPWLSFSEQRRPFGPVPEQYQTLCVADLFLPNSTEWDLGKLDLILPFYKEQIQRIRPSKHGLPDELVWLKNPSGEYSTCSGYLTLSEEREGDTPMVQATPCNWLANVWNIKTAEKVKLFIWKSLQNALPVGEQFAIRSIPISPLCKRCNTEESILHLLFQCPYAAKVWELAPLATMINTDSLTTCQEAWERVRKISSLPPSGIDAGTLSSWIIWSLWISRNQLTFQNRNFTPEETVQKAQPPSTSINLSAEAFDQIGTTPFSCWTMSSVHRCSLEPCLWTSRSWLDY